MDEQSREYQKECYLDKRLAIYTQMDHYPFHMPGHKRRKLDFIDPYGIDITEIEGFDDLHHAEGILLQAQERLRELYHSIKAYYLINGSTGGILSAIGALTKPGDHILIARNCHKSVYNAVRLFQLKLDFIYPQLMDRGIQGIVDAKEIEALLKVWTDIKLVVVTSPTYEGIVSDIKEIADLALKYHFYLIVDEAHGAHFSFSKHFPESAVSQNADIVIQSLHKTLPSFTQTAVLHVVSGRVNCDQIEEMLGILQTSSPSYVLMAGIDRCVRLLQQSAGELFERFHERLQLFYQGCKQLKCLSVLTAEDYEAYDVYAVDRSKIVISTLHTAIDGYALYCRLLEEYHLQLEMYSAQYVLAMTSIMDTQEGLDRLLHALLEIDMELDHKGRTLNEQCDVDHPGLFLEQAYRPREKVLEISDVVVRSKEEDLKEVEWKESIGMVCAEYVYLYPPGIPMIVPGERISREFIEILEKCRRLKLNVQGMKDKQWRKITIVRKV